MSNDFKVIKIINDTSLIVNGGSNNGISRGDMMQIIGKGETIIDPETKENLGNLEIVKARLNVTEVYEKMCVCETAYISEYMSSIFSNNIFGSKQKKLEIEPTEISGDGDKTIRIGDMAKHIKIEKKDK